MTTGRSQWHIYTGQTIEYIFLNCINSCKLLTRHRLTVTSAVRSLRSHVCGHTPEGHTRPSGPGYTFPTITYGITFSPSGFGAPIENNSVKRTCEKYFCNKYFLEWHFLLSSRCFASQSKDVLTNAFQRLVK